MGIALRNKKGKKAGKTMSPAQRAVIERLLAKARPIKGDPTRALL